MGIIKFAISLAVFYNFYNSARAWPLLAIIVGYKNNAYKIEQYEYLSVGN